MTTMFRVSEAQKALLKLLLDGSTVVIQYGGSKSAFIVQKRADRPLSACRIHLKTVYALIRKELLREISQTWLSSEYALSSAGKKEAMSD